MNDEPIYFTLSLGMSTPSQETQITEFLQAVVRTRGRTDGECTGAELTYQLPDDKAHTATYEALFTKLDANLQHLGISSYGVSDTTLEEVLLYSGTCLKRLSHWP